MASKFDRFIKRVIGTQGEEIDCAQCLDQVSAYVELELTGSSAAAKLPQVKHHLDQCGVCREEYLLLRDLARLADQDALPEVQDLIDRLKDNPNT